MIESSQKRLEGRLDVREVEDPAGGGIYRTGGVYADTEAVAVEAAALVVRRDVREAVGGLEGEFFEDLHTPLCNLYLNNPISSTT